MQSKFEKFKSEIPNEREKQTELGNASFEFLGAFQFALQQAIKVSREIQAVALTVF